MPLFGSMATKGKGMATIPNQAGTPSITSQASGSIGLSWTAPAFTGGAPLTDYKLEYSTNSGSSWTTYSHTTGWVTSVTTTGLADYLTYIWRVSAINAVGSGAVSANSAGAAQFNAASGGTEATITNYNGTGQTWKVHTFNSNSALVVTASLQPFKVLIVGGGGGGGGTNGPGGGGGWGGGKYENSAVMLTLGSNTVTIGGGGSAGAGANTGAGGGGTSFLGVLSGSGGQAGNTGHSHGTCDLNGAFDPNCRPPDTSFTSTITGATVGYSYAGASGYSNNTPAAAQTCGGNGAYDAYNSGLGGPGGSGIVIAAYRIA